MINPDSNTTKDLFIKCDCGTHVLQVQSSVDTVYDDANQCTRYSQDINIAMFKFGSGPDTKKWWQRIIVGLKYIWNGKMFADQVVLCPKEARKLREFLSENIIEN